MGQVTHSTSQPGLAIAKLQGNFGVFEHHFKYPHLFILLIYSLNLQTAGFLFWSKQTFNKPKPSYLVTLSCPHTHTHAYINIPKIIIFIRYPSPSQSFLFFFRNPFHSFILLPWDAARRCWCSPQFWY